MAKSPQIPAKADSPPSPQGRARTPPGGLGPSQEDPEEQSPTGGPDKTGTAGIFSGRSGTSNLPSPGKGSGQKIRILAGPGFSGSGVLGPRGSRTPLTGLDDRGVRDPPDPKIGAGGDPPPGSLEGGSDPPLAIFIN